MFLVNSRCHHFSATRFRSGCKILHVLRAYLLPRLRYHFAEFLNQGSLKRLGILTLPTCVGLRYDHLIISLEAFLGSLGSMTLRTLSSASHLRVIRKRIYLSPTPTCLHRLFQQTDHIPSCVTPSLNRLYGGTGILTCFPSPTLFSLGLGYRLTLRRLALLRNP